MLVIVTDRDGEVSEYEVDQMSELYIALSSDMKIDAVCGGECSCGTCHVYLDNEIGDVFVSPGELELEAIDGLMNKENNSRLLCQLDLKKDVSVVRLVVAESE